MRYLGQCLVLQHDGKHFGAFWTRVIHDQIVPFALIIFVFQVVGRGVVVGLVVVWLVGPPRIWR